MHVIGRTIHETELIDKKNMTPGFCFDFSSYRVHRCIGDRTEGDRNDIRVRGPTTAQTDIIEQSDAEEHDR